MGNNTEIVVAAYTAFGSGDLPGLLELMSDEIAWETPVVTGASFGGLVQGKDDVAEFFGHLAEDEDITNFEPQEFIEGENNVVAIGTITSTIRSTGKEYTMKWVHIFDLRDSKITSFREFFDTAVVEKAFQKAASA